MKNILWTILMMFIISASCTQKQNTFESVLAKAEQGDAEAQQKLGNMYATGENVLKDFKKAFYWYEKSAEQGKAAAQHNLGLVYLYGEGKNKDFKKAA